MVGVRLNLHDRAYCSEFAAPKPTESDVGPLSSRTSPQTPAVNGSSLGANRVFG